MRSLPALPALALILLSMPAAKTQTPTARIVTAAKSFLATLDARQRQTVSFAFDDEEQRKRWSNFPTGFVPRGGMSLKDMSPSQRSAAMALVSAALSRRGFEKVEKIMEADEALKLNEGSRGPSGRGGGPPGGNRGGGGNQMFGKDLYYISILGTPSAAAPWMLQFGGHHLALNITIDGERGILTPTLTGAQPALYVLNGNTVRPLSGESDKGAALLASLNDGQRKQAILNYRVADLVLGPGKDGKTIEPEGIQAANMNEKQRALLMDVIAEWAGIIHESAASRRIAELKAELDQTYFAWSGPATVAAGSNIAAYYRIQGPHLVIEYAPQQMGGDPSMHVHTMYRDPTNDYGRKNNAK